MFINDNFILDNEYSQELYHKYAENMPIIDYHNHLEADKIAANYKFSSITELWLGGDHYKWRLMRANGVDEYFITGKASDYEKFEKWAATVPYAMRNPLYHWSHLELKRYFGIDEVLKPETSKMIFDRCNELLQQDDFTTQGLLKRMHVETLCTTNDPIETLEYHQQIKESSFNVKVLPTWRPDKLMAIEDLTIYNAYLKKLGEVADVTINSFDALLTAVQKRQDFFEKMGCKLSDHGISELEFVDFDENQLPIIFQKILIKKPLTEEDILTYKSGVLYHLTLMNYKKNWVQQFHIGAIRNNNARLMNSYGVDAGADSIHDGRICQAMSNLLKKLDGEGHLAKTVFYNLNPKDNDAMVSMLYNFNDGSVAGKMQYGAAWWFLDHKDGIESQLKALSNGGLLSRFVGMLTDSRSFISFTRHEYFRRILCNLIGNDIEKGYLPKSEMAFIGQMVSDICYNNAQKYFNF